MEFLNRLFLSLMSGKKVRRTWQRVILSMACVTVFVTVYLLILPAISIDKEEASDQAGVYLKEDPAAAGSQNLKAGISNNSTTTLIFSSASETLLMEDVAETELEDGILSEDGLLVDPDRNVRTDDVPDAFAIDLTDDISTDKDSFISGNVPGMHQITFDSENASMIFGEIRSEGVLNDAKNTSPLIPLSDAAGFLREEDSVSSVDLVSSVDSVSSVDQVLSLDSGMQMEPEMLITDNVQEPVSVEESVNVQDLAEDSDPGFEDESVGDGHVIEGYVSEGHTGESDTKDQYAGDHNAEDEYTVVGFITEEGYKTATEGTDAEGNINEADVISEAPEAAVTTESLETAVVEDAAEMGIVGTVEDMAEMDETGQTEDSDEAAAAGFGLAEDSADAADAPDDRLAETAVNAADAAEIGLLEDSAEASDAENTETETAYEIADWILLDDSVDQLLNLEPAADELVSTGEEAVGESGNDEEAAGETEEAAETEETEETVEAENAEGMEAEDPVGTIAEFLLEIPVSEVSPEVLTEDKPESDETAGGQQEEETENDETSGGQQEEEQETEESAAAYLEEEPETETNAAALANEESEKKEMLEALVEEVTETAATSEDIVEEESETDESAETLAAEELVAEAIEETADTEVEEPETEANTEEVETEEEPETEAIAEEAETEEAPETEAIAEEAETEEETEDLAEEETETEETSIERQGTVLTVRPEGADYTINAEFGPEEELPEDARLEATVLTEESGYAQYASRALETVLADNTDAEDTDLRLLGVFDLTVFDGDGEIIHPQSEATIHVSFDSGLQQEAKVYAVHFPGTGLGGLEQLKSAAPKKLKAFGVSRQSATTLGTDCSSAELINTEHDDAETVFEVNGFSVFAIVGTVIEKSVLASDGNYYKISVTYGADAKLPEDVELRVTELDQDSEEFGHYLQESAEKLGKEAEAVSYARIFDISLISKNDPKIHYQPEAEVSVQIELVDANENLIKDLTVLHISEDQVDIVDTQTEGKALSFQTGSFSIYPIVDGTGENARIGYRFWYFNAATGTYEQISTQYFRYKDVHSEPAADILEPGIPGISQSDFVRIFEGWFKGTVDDDSAQLQDPGMTTAELNAELHNYQEDDFVEGTVIDVVAKLKDAYYITYVDINSSNILATDLVVKEESGDTYFVVKDGVRPTKYENKLTGWRLLDEIDNSDAQLYEANHSYTIAENITLAPVIDGGYWLVYDDNDLVDDGTGKMVSGGASYTAPEFYMNSMEEQQPTRQPENPVWQGYEFGGWYTDAACTTPFEFGGLLTENTTVYAKWIPSDSAYRVIVWKQKSTDGVGLDNSEKKYDYDFSVLVDSGVKTGDLVYLDNNYTTIYGEGGTSQDTDKDYFVYNYEKTDPYIVVKADGSSVINVYYDRVPMSINFYTWGNGYVYTETTSNTGTQYGVVNGEYVPLTYIDSEEDIYTYTYAPVYSGTTGNTGTQYGIIDGDYQQLTREAVYSYTFNAYIPTTGTTGTQYALVDGEYVELIKNSKYYPVSGTSYTQSTNDNGNNPQKWGIYNGSIIPVYYGTDWLGRNRGWYRTFNEGIFSDYYSDSYGGG